MGKIYSKTSKGVESQRVTACLLTSLVLLDSIASKSTIRFTNHFQWIFLASLFTLGAWRCRSIARTLQENVARINAFNNQSGKSYKLGVNQFADRSYVQMKSSKLHEIYSRAICDRSPQVFLQCQLQLIAERKELLPLSRAKAGVESTHPSENNTESLYIKTYFLTLFFSLLLNQNVGFWWAFRQWQPLITYLNYWRKPWNTQPVYKEIP